VSAVAAPSVNAAAFADQCRCELCAEVFNIIMEYVDGPDLFEYVREHVRCAR
jgi:hypothetical protein